MDEKKSDIFAYGIALFSAIMLRSPFDSEVASKNDALFQFFYQNKPQKFWESKEIIEILTYLEKEDPAFDKTSFIDLINKALNVDP